MHECTNVKVINSVQVHDSKIRITSCIEKHNPYYIQSVIIKVHHLVYYYQCYYNPRTQYSKTYMMFLTDNTRVKINQEINKAVVLKIFGKRKRYRDSYNLMEMLYVGLRMRIKIVYKFEQFFLLETNEPL